VGSATGFDTVRAPKETANICTAYRVQVPSGSLNFVVSDYYNSGFAWDPDNRLRQLSYAVANASVEWLAPKNAWGVRLRGKNLFGAQYCRFGTAGTLNDTCSPAPSRTYGMTLSANF
jgi:iron complex outermembrane recepter protein